jgi:betaine-homocysteine S-methyltransferase
MILDLLRKGTVLGDGGSVFELERRGYMSAGPFVPVVAIEQPEALRQLQVDFARAGAQVLQALTYYAHEEKLRQSDHGFAVGDINEAAVTIAREVADTYGCLVAGNLSNTWVYDPGDPVSYRKTRTQFDEQISCQMPHGTDFFVAETFEYLGEAKIALEAIRATGMPSMVTLTFKAADRTLEGILLEEAVKELEDLGADIVGINCARDPQRMMPLARRIREAVSCFVATQPVAYRCSDERPYFQAQEIDGRPAFPLELDPFVLTRFEMAEYAVAAERSSINYIGGCCGTAPHHLRAMAEALGRTVPSSRYDPRLDLHPGESLR